jgi:hypothetical protein
MKLSLDKIYFKKYERESNYIHEPVPVTYQTFTIDEKKYFQMDSYSKGVNINEIGSSKQSNHKLQFDRETAKKFIDLLKKELDIL